MAAFTGDAAFATHDDYMTPKTAWEAVKHVIPVGKVIWEPFYGDGSSGDYLRELGYEVIHEDEDFFKNNKGDIIVSNPPFSMGCQVLKRLVEIGKPFILILPSLKICTQYMRKLFTDSTDPIQIIIPRKRIEFDKLVNGQVPEGYKSRCNFYCFYFCWKIGLPRDIVWLE